MSAPDLDYTSKIIQGGSLFVGIPKNVSLSALLQANQTLPGGWRKKSLELPFRILLRSYKFTEKSFKNSNISTLTASCSTMERPSRSSKSSRPVQCGFGRWLSLVSQDKGLVTLKQQTSKFSGSNYFTLQVDGLQVDIWDPDLQHCFSKPPHYPKYSK